MSKGKSYTSEHGTITVITNGHARDLVSWHDLPTEQREYFDYVTDEEDRYSPRFVEYLGSWYDVNEFERVGTYRNFELLYRWHGIQTDSYFSATLIRYADSDCESVVIGRCFW